LTLNWSGALTSANLTSDAPGVHGLSGDRLPFVPRFSTTLDANYTWSAFGDYRGFVGATWVYVGDRAGDFSSGGFHEDCCNPFADAFLGQVKVASYNTLSGRIGVEDDRWRFEVWGRNILGSKGVTSAGDSYPGFPAAMAVVPPPTVGLTISAKFH
jgi:hypothetical protein